MQHHTKPLMTLRSPFSRRRGIAVSVVDTILMWVERNASRRALMKLDTRQLQDIGVSRFDAVKEGQKPFWRS